MHRASALRAVSIHKAPSNYGSSQARVGLLPDMMRLGSDEADDPVWQAYLTKEHSVSTLKTWARSLRRLRRSRRWKSTRIGLVASP
jgi:hypothetical protein